MITGVSGTGAIGTAVPAYDRDVSVTGVVGTSAIGSDGATVIPAVAGVSGTGAIGSLGTDVDETIIPTGVAGTGAIGTITRGGWTNVEDSQTPNWIDIDTAA